MQPRPLDILFVLISVGAGGSSVACGGVTTSAGRDAGSDATDAGDAGTKKETGEGGCRSVSDCPPGTDDSIAYCAASYDWVGCMPGCRPQTSCMQSSECDAGSVCRQSSQPIGCGQIQGDAYCSPPCKTDDDCPPTQKCSSGECAARTCSECPAYFSCPAGVCAYKACKSDKDCPTGYCVNDSCAGALGACGAYGTCG